MVLKRIEREWMAASWLGLVFVIVAGSQSDSRQLQPMLSAPVQSSQVTEFQLRRYLMKRVTPVSAPADAAKWSAEAQRIRTHLLDDVIFHGWPKEWESAGPKFEEVGAIETGNGYRIVKLRYE